MRVKPHCCYWLSYQVADSIVHTVKLFGLCFNKDKGNDPVDVYLSLTACAMYQS